MVLKKFPYIIVEDEARLRNPVLRDSFLTRVYTMTRLRDALESKDSLIQYCKDNLQRICQQFGGDSKNIFICGFSRGAIACSYIGLADDEIASFWKGMITHDHFDGHKEWGYPQDGRSYALKRIARLKGKPVLVCGKHAEYLKNYQSLAQFTFLPVPAREIFQIPEGKVIHPHTDMWAHRQSTTRQIARDWLLQNAGLN